MKGNVNILMSKKRVAIIGTGAIGMTIAEELKVHLAENYELVGMLKRTDDQIKEISTKLNTKVVTEFSELLRLTPDFIIESASVDIVKEHGEDILSHGIHFIPLSVGALANQDLYESLQKKAQANKAVLYIPSGAIAGFDLMRKMTLADIPEVEINTYKSPASLNDAPFLKDRVLVMDEKEVIFDGSAQEAIKGFPQNINVAVATGLATIGPENVRTIIHSIPELEANIHEITVRNQEGTADIRFAGAPSNNKRPSSITPWSVISLLKNISDPVRFF